MRGGELQQHPASARIDRRGGKSARCNGYAGSGGVGWFLRHAAMVAAGLSALTEQLAYIEIGLAVEDPDAATIERLGRSCALIWCRTIRGAAA